MPTLSAVMRAAMRTIGARRPPSLTVEPTMNWPSAYIASIDESISPSAESSSACRSRATTCVASVSGTSPS